MSNAPGARHLHLATCACTRIGPALTVTLGCPLHDPMFSNPALAAELRKLGNEMAKTDGIPDTLPGGTCDWGDCDGLAEGWRRDDRSGQWLPVCVRHSIAGRLTGLTRDIGGEMTGTQTLGHLRTDHEDCECTEQLDHDLYVCNCPGYPVPSGKVAP